MKCFQSLFFLFLGALSIVFAVELPTSGFKLLSSGAQGFDLVWSSPSVKEVHTGRFEFRWADGTVLGYPQPVQNSLVLPLSSASQAALASQSHLSSLQVWLGNQRIDRDDAKPMRRLQPEPIPPYLSFNITKVNTHPAKKGNYTIRRAVYKLEGLAFDHYKALTEVIAEVTDPPLATGQRPLVVFIHGRHAVCYKTEGIYSYSSAAVWPCRAGWLQVPSFKGYRYIADILASQGYIVVSISANGISAQDYDALDFGSRARATLIRHHLLLWAQWNTNGGSPWGDRFKDRVDMNKVVLVGHSRGGEGVHKAAVDASPANPYKIVGLVTFSPTAFGRHVNPNVHSATILPTCDGNVFHLEGQAYVDASRDIAFSEALRTAVIAIGANHNYFNTEWTPGFAAAPAEDDWTETSDYECGSDRGRVRLTPEEQQMVGATYTAALVKLAVNQDTNMLPLLDGTRVRPASIGRAEVVTSAVGGAKNRILYRPEDAGHPILYNGMLGEECLGNPNYKVNVSFPVCVKGYYDYSPHWLWMYTRPGLAMNMRWIGSVGAMTQFRVSSALRNLTTLDFLDARIASHPLNQGVLLDVMIADQNGRNATLKTNFTALDCLPGSSRKIHAQTLRGSLASVRTQVDLSRITSIFLVARSATGRVYVLDIAASQNQVKVPAVLNLPRISLETVTFMETDRLTQYRLNIVSSRPLTRNASIWVDGLTVSDGYPKAYQLDLVPGNSTVVGSILYDYVGDHVYTPNNFSSVTYIEAIKGVVTDNYMGSISIVDDEKPPILSVNSSNITAMEGQSLNWRLDLSTNTEGTTVTFVPVKPNQGNELTSHDVPPSWLRSWGISVPSTPTPFSELYIFLEVEFDYGRRSADLVIPLTDDGLAEGNKVLALQQQYHKYGNVSTLFGVVIDKL